MDLGINGKVALVTAASRGLGFACAQALAAEGARVAICSRSRIRINKAARKLSKDYSADVHGYVCDLRKPDHLKRLLGNVQNDLGSVDIFVFNTGNPPPGDFRTMPESSWEDGLSLVLRPSIMLSKALLPKMVKKKWGRIIFITSIFAREPDPEYVISSTLRAGMLALVKCLARDTARHGITVNTVMPGFFNTPLVRGLAEKEAAKRKVRVSAVMSGWAKSLPRGNLGDPRDLGDLVAWLSGSSAGNVSGDAIQSDGVTMRGT